MTDDVLTAKEVAAILRVSPKTVRRLPLPVVKLGPGTLRYLRSDVFAYLERIKRAA